MKSKEKPSDEEGIRTLQSCDKFVGNIYENY
jgi:hypothetical protein